VTSTTLTITFALTNTNIITFSGSLTITFALTNTNIITFSGSLTPNIQAGIEIDGGSVCSSPPAVVIKGNGVK